MAKEDKLIVEAKVEKQEKVKSFVTSQLEGTNCNRRAKNHLDLAVEEIFVNIAVHAYKTKEGKAIIRTSLSDDMTELTVTFMDEGIKYNPLERPDPDVTLPVSEREIGGLGVFITKKVTDGISYEYRDGKNILQIKKKLTS